MLAAALIDYTRNRTDWEIVQKFLRAFCSDADSAWEIQAAINAGDTRQAFTDRFLDALPNVRASASLHELAALILWDANWPLAAITAVEVDTWFDRLISLCQGDEQFEQPILRAGQKTLSGRILGDAPWQRPTNYSYKWADHDAINLVVNYYMQREWKYIQAQLLVDGIAEFTVKVDVPGGDHPWEGFWNAQAEKGGVLLPRPSQTDYVRIIWAIGEKNGKQEVYVISAFPCIVGHALSQQPAT